MKVVALTNHLSSRGGGVPSAMLRLYELLARKGIEVELVASDPPEDAAWAGSDHAKSQFSSQS
jgi:hypothetical protein